MVWIEGSTNLTEDAWRPVSSNIAATPGMNIRTVQVDRVGPQYFRIRAE